MFFSNSFRHFTVIVFGTFIFAAGTGCFADENSPFRFDNPEGHRIVLLEKNRPLWQYKGDFQAVPDVPEKDPRFMAGSYIHPLYGIDGETLTDDAPKDHYHHHGVFWNWPHVSVRRPDGHVEKYDSWTGNTRLKQLFVRVVEMKTDEKSATFRVENGWFIATETNKFEFDEKGNPISEKIAKEEVSVTTWPIREENGIRSRAIDLDFVWTIGAFPITLQGAEGKSYGGLTIRFRPSNSKPGGDSIITVPSGVAKDDLPDTPLPWADYTSVFRLDADGKPKGEQSGAAIFVPPTHPDYPPTWLTRYYGPLCVGWPGVEKREFKPDEKIRLSYRIWIHDQKVAPETLLNEYERYSRQCETGKKTSDSKPSKSEP